MPPVDFSPKYKPLRGERQWIGAKTPPILLSTIAYLTSPWGA